MHAPYAVPVCGGGHARTSSNAIYFFKRISDPGDLSSFYSSRTVQNNNDTSDALYKRQYVCVCVCVCVCSSLCVEGRSRHSAIERSKFSFDLLYIIYIYIIRRYGDDSSGWADSSVFSNSGREVWWGWSEKSAIIRCTWLF